MRREHIEDREAIIALCAATSFSQLGRDHPGFRNRLYFGGMLARAFFSDIKTDVFICLCVCVFVSCPIFRWLGAANRTTPKGRCYHSQRVRRRGSWDDLPDRRGWCLIYLLSFSPWRLPVPHRPSLSIATLTFNLPCRAAFSCVARFIAGFTGLRVVNRRKGEVAHVVWSAIFSTATLCDNPLGRTCRSGAQPCLTVWLSYRFCVWTPPIFGALWMGPKQ